MYITTFYSFKGGVGRTLSMVNVALELANNGRKVLIVDFDLEAPGIETFNLPKPAKDSLGIVDYVTQYKEDGGSPDVRDYVYKSEITCEDDGELWVMPSGRHDQDYAKRLNQIKWDDLYNHDDGFLMIEDMKAQWKSALSPDYVLIDSRTGHTDVSGICTRQLPDAVVVLFFPNEQNLLGLEKIVPSIRAESKVRNRKQIQLHFVSSNVPNLDDENKILENKMSLFKERLKYKKLACIIHHYDHLSLLNQEIFTQTHPRSRLANEYRILYQEIIKHNPEDRLGVIDFLKEITDEPRKNLKNLTASVLENRLENILAEHSADQQVLAKIASYRYRVGNDDAAYQLVSESIKLGNADPEYLLMKGKLGFSLGEANYIDDIRAVLESPRSGYFDTTRAIEFLKKTHNLEIIGKISSFLAFNSLTPDSKFVIASELDNKKEFLPAAKQVLYDLLSKPEADVEININKLVKNKLMLFEIALGNFSAARNIVGKNREDIFEYDIAEVFNYAMAEWGETGKIPIDLFQHVRELDVESKMESTDPNYLQCLAIASYCIQDIPCAKKFLEKANQQIMSKPGSQFSAWRFMTTTYDDFLRDNELIEKMIDGKQSLPIFMTEKTLNLL